MLLGTQHLHMSSLGRSWTLACTTFGFSPKVGGKERINDKGQHHQYHPVKKKKKKKKKKKRERERCARISAPSHVLL